MADRGGWSGQRLGPSQHVVHGGVVGAELQCLLSVPFEHVGIRYLCLQATAVEATHGDDNKKKV